MSQTAKHIFVIIVFIAALSCFSFLFLGNIPKAILVIVDSLIIGFLILSNINERNNNIKTDQYFKLEFNLLLFSAVISPIMAYVYHEQSIFTSYYMNRALFLYAFYFLLARYDFESKALVKIILILTFIHLIFYFIQFSLYPRIIFDVRIETRRGSISVFLPGLYFIAWSYFYFINRFAMTKKVINLILAGVLLTEYILLANRNILGAIFAVTLVYIVLSKHLSIKLKTILGILIILLSVLLYFMFEEILLNLIEYSKTNKYNESIRIYALNFFLSDFQPHWLTYILGNGESNENFLYGRQVLYYKLAYRYYQTDIGILGDYTKFGLPFLIAAMLIFFKTIVHRISSVNSNIKYFFMFLFLISFTRDGPFSWEDSIILICASLYLLDKDQIFKKQKNKA